MSQNRIVKDRNDLDDNAIRKNVEFLSKPIEDYKKKLSPSPAEYTSFKRNLIDEIEPFSSLRKKGYYTSEHYELRVRDLTPSSGKLVFSDHKKKISEIESFTLNQKTDIVKQLKKPAKKLLRKLRGKL